MWYRLGCYHKIKDFDPCENMMNVTTTGVDTAKVWLQNGKRLQLR